MKKNVIKKNITSQVKLQLYLKVIANCPKLDFLILITVNNLHLVKNLHYVLTFFFSVINGDLLVCKKKACFVL